MANFGQSKPSEARAPETEILPDGRRRITRFYRVSHKDKIPTELDLAWGAADIGTTTVEGWDGVALLVGRKVTDQVGPKGRDTDPLLVLVFEEIHATAETQVGLDGVAKLEDGRTATTVELLQFASASFVPGAVGSAGSGARGYLLKVEHTNDGTLHRIKRFYVTAGTLRTDEQIKEAGALTIKIIESAVTVPETPVGYTLIGKPTQNPNGLPIYTYAYAKGDGLVFTETKDHLDGRVTYTTKRAYGAPSAATGEFETTTQQEDGYTVYVSRGIVVNSADLPDEVTRRNKGKLVITRKRKIGVAPTGTGEVILDTADPQEGYTLYTKAWAVGEGLVTTEIRDHLDGRVTYTTKRAYGTAVAATGEFETTTEDDDGYTVYISRGIVVNSADLPDEVTRRNKGKLVITRKRKIGVAPTGTGEVILDTADPQEGYTLYTKAWAVGEGLVTTQTRDHLDGRVTYTTKRAYGTAVAATGEFETTTEDDDGYTVYISRGIVVNSADLPDEVTRRNKGKLVITRKRKIGVAPTGTGEVILDTADPQEGYTLYTKAWAVGEGLVTTQTRDHLDGRVTYTTKRAYGTAVAATGEFETTTEDDDGYTVYISRGIEINSADLPDEVTRRNKGKLVITRKRKIGVAPTGTGEVILDTADPQEGYTLYTKAWAVGEGLVTTEIRDHLDGRVTYTTKRAYGTAVPATGEFETTTEDDDGYTVYISRGIEINNADLPDEVTRRNKGKLVITRKRKIGVAPTGTGEVILDTADPQEGYTLYTKAWAVGEGLVTTATRQELDGAITYTTKRAYGTAVPATGEFETTTEDDDGYTVYISRGIVVNTADLPDETDASVGGALTLTTKRKIDTAPTGGTGSLIRVRAEPRDGYTLYSRTWASGSGAGESRTIGEPDGAITQIVTELASGAATPTSPGAGYHLVDLTSTPLDGYTLNVARYKKPPTTVTYRKIVDFPFPGQVLYTSGATHSISLQPPTTRRLLASVEESYDTAQITDTPWALLYGAYLNESFTIKKADGTADTPQGRQRGLGGYVSAGFGLSDSGDYSYNGIICTEHNVTVAASNPTTVPSGATVIGVDNEPYLTSTAGVQVFKRTKVSYTF